MLPESKVCKAKDKFEQIDIGDFIEGKLFKENAFRKAVRSENWSKFEGQRVLVKPCGSGPVPAWAFMLILAQLMPFANRSLMARTVVRLSFTNVAWKNRE